MGEEIWVVGERWVRREDRKCVYRTRATKTAAIQRISQFILYIKRKELTAAYDNRYFSFCKYYI